MHGNATVMVSDFSKALEFYTKVLGFKVMELYGKEWASLKIPGLTIGLHPQEKGMKLNREQSPISIGLSVDDIEEEMKILKTKGISAFQLYDEGPVITAYFEDPDGNPLYLVQMKEG